MLSFFSILLAIAMALFGVSSNNNTIGVIGGSDGPASVLLSGEAVDPVPITDDAAMHLQQLTHDEYTLLQAKLLTSVDGVDALLDRYAATNGTVPIARYELSGLRDTLKDVIAEFPAPQTEAGQELFSQQLSNAATVAGLFNSYEGNTAAAVISSVLFYHTICTLTLESSMYLLEYENGVGIIVGIWNDGTGLCLVTATFVPNASLPLEEMMGVINGNQRIQ